MESLELYTLKGLHTFIEKELDDSISIPKLKDIYREIRAKYFARSLENLDMYIELDNHEYRVIGSWCIDEVHLEATKDIVTECYFTETNLDKLWWIKIDWKATSNTLIETDGYANMFASYDHYEYEFDMDNRATLYFFRTN